MDNQVGSDYANSSAAIAGYNHYGRPVIEATSLDRRAISGSTVGAGAVSGVLTTTGADSLSYYQQPLLIGPGNPQPYIPSDAQFLKTVTVNKPYFGEILPMISEKQYLVQCNGRHDSADSLEEAQALAERLAHQYQAEAIILKPIRKVAPKRDVVTTEL